MLYAKTVHQLLNTSFTKQNKGGNWKDFIKSDDAKTILNDGEKVVQEMTSIEIKSKFTILPSFKIYSLTQYWSLLVGFVFEPRLLRVPVFDFVNFDALPKTS